MHASAFRRAALGILVGALLVFGSAVSRAAIVVVHIEGTFGTGFDGNPLNPAFPNPGLVNGSFSGTFTYDDAAAPFFSSVDQDRFDVLSNNVELRTPANVLDYTITIDGNNELRLISDPGSERLIIFLGDSTTSFPDDLRLNFDIGGLGIVADGSPLTAAEFALAVTSGIFQPDPFSLLDVEAEPTDLTLGIVDARVTIVDVPEPGTLVLLAIGLIGLLPVRRHAAAECKSVVN